MKESTSKEKVLKRVRAALINKSKEAYTDVDFDSPIYQKSEDPLEILFAEKFTALNGQFAFCENENEFLETFSELLKANENKIPFCLEEPLQNLLKKGNISFSDQKESLTQFSMTITLCEFLVARTGSIFVSSKQSAGRKLAAFPDIHVVVAYASQLVEEIKDALKKTKEKYPERIPSLMTLITGPSRTADIEKTLILGAHGPKEIYVFLIDDNI